jgi:hypothetical protein
VSAHAVRDHRVVFDDQHLRHVVIIGVDATTER